MPSDDELLDDLTAALRPPDRTPRPDRVAAIRAAAAHRAELGAAVAPLPAPPLRRAVVAALTAAAVVAAFFVGGAVVDSAPADPPPLEFAAVLTTPDGGARAEVEGVALGIGRLVRLESDDLPILPVGEYYEVWFVGPGDAPGAPDRISAGTFHPDADGFSGIELTAAVDPTKYPVMAVTAEPGDGDPRPTGADVLRAELVLTGGG